MAQSAGPGFSPIDAGISHLEACIETRSPPLRQPASRGLVSPTPQNVTMPPMTNVSECNLLLDRFDAQGLVGDGCALVLEGGSPGLVWRE